MDLSGVLDELKAASARVYVAATGAGMGLPDALWSAPGSSAFFVGASLPYSEAAIDDFLRFGVERYCSPETALDLATEAFVRAGARDGAIGIGLTASVASNEPHRGDHRIHAAWLTSGAAGTHDVRLVKGSGEAKRREDGEAATLVGLNALSDALGLPRAFVLAGAERYETADATDAARDRFFEHPYFRADGRREAVPKALPAALPGTFDPPHEGHFGMADAFTKLAGTPPAFWVTAEPPHKAAVPLAELLRRAARLRGREALFTRGEPLYLDKARAFPGCAFVIGADALVRMLDARWGPSVDELVSELRALGARFHVASRLVDGTLVTLDDVPEAPRDLFSPLPGRWDVSSTELRGARSR